MRSAGMPSRWAASVSMLQDGRMLRVIVTGGGIAALETLAGLATLAPGRVEATLVAPVRDFSYRPLSTAAPFTRLGRRTRALADLASELGARHVRDGLADVDCGRGRVLTHDGAFLGYDALVVAVGARRRGLGLARRRSVDGRVRRPAARARRRRSGSRGVRRSSRPGMAGRRLRARTRRRPHSGARAGSADHPGDRGV